ncbi:MAG TPA: Holliday junction resolvase RuvX [Cyclobacteriaceae bacterium]|jgi:putative Holliday junction resolvase
MGRILALDYGLKRTGIAVTDPSRIISTPLLTIHTSGLFEFLKSYFMKEQVEIIVVGMPRKLDNTPTDMTKPVEKLVDKLKKTFPDKKVTLQDERFTSSIARAAILESGMKKKGRRKKENVDKISATLILQSYMESQK